MRSHVLCALNVSEGRSSVALQQECSHKNVAQKPLPCYDAHLHPHDELQFYYRALLLEGKGWVRNPDFIIFIEAKHSLFFNVNS